MCGAEGRSGSERTKADSILLSFSPHGRGRRCRVWAATRCRFFLAVLSLMCAHEAASFVPLPAPALCSFSLAARESLVSATPPRFGIRTAVSRAGVRRMREHNGKGGEGPSDLPEGWASAIDDASGDTYYYNEAGESSWEKPAGEGAGDAQEPVHSLSTVESLLVSARRNFLRNVAVWFVVSWSISKMFPNPETAERAAAPSSGAAKIGGGGRTEDLMKMEGEVMEVDAAAKEAVINSVQAEVVQAVSSALEEALQLEFGGWFGIVLVPLFRPLALFATDLMLDLQEESLAGEWRESIALKDESETKPQIWQKAAAQTSTVMIARSAAARTSLLVPLGHFGGMFDQPTVTKILTKTLMKVEENLAFEIRQRLDRQKLPNGGKDWFENYAINSQIAAEKAQAQFRLQSLSTLQWWIPSPLSWAQRTLR
mmetsp:Transcript_37408/g.76776  ORF Transcript_37408/g.76776 Transcript_37408/m.76776 type:complete len:427 (-) Transcript_37408:602-1882(-)